MQIEYTQNSGNSYFLKSDRTLYRNFIEVKPRLSHPEEFIEYQIAQIDRASKLRSECPFFTPLATTSSNGNMHQTT